MSTEIFPYGTLVRVTEAHQLDGEHRVEKGQEFTVDAYVSAESDDGIAYYVGDDDHWTATYAAPDKVELVKTAEQLAARRIPTAEQIIAELSCLDDYEGFELNAADAPEGASRELSGVTDEGLPFAFTITVSNIYQAER